MDEVVTFVNQLGPWGPVLGAALVILVQRLKAKYPNLIPSPAPTPAPVPVPAPQPAPQPAPVPPAVPDRPILAALLKLLLASLVAKAAKEGRPVEEVVAEKVNEVEGS